MKGKIASRIVSAALAFAISLGAIGFTASAAISNDSNEKTSSAKTNTVKTDFNYVSLGASNVSGFGMHGYNNDIVYDAPLEKENGSLHGYKMNTPGTYPVLLSERLAESHKVNFSQMAMSSMRAEDLRFLLDESYKGDSYTDYWLFDTNGDGKSENYFYTAGLYEWNSRKEAGLPGYDHTPTNEEVIATLRDEYVQAISNADLITLDIGMNNFGTYISNPLEGNAFSSDLSNITPELGEYYNQGREFILDIIKSQMDGAVIPEETLNVFVDTFVYALVGYCYNIDKDIEIIYSLNPDVELVLVGVQNIAHEMELAIPGLEFNIPLGDIWGLIINAANLYTSVLSPYSDRYHYADVLANGRVDYFIDELVDYNGNPATISQHMKDCFDVYDTTFLLKTRIQQMYAVQMSQMGFVSLSAAQMDMATTEGLYEFYYGFHYDIYPGKSTPIKAAGDIHLKDFIKMGEEGKLGNEAKSYYEMYEKMISVSYDVILEILREAATIDCIDLGSMAEIETAGVAAFGSIFSVLGDAIGKALTKQDYYFDINTEYPDGFFKTVSAEFGLADGMLESMLCFLIRIDMGGGFFAHPNEKGNKEACDIIWNAYTKGITGKEIVADQMGIYYLPDQDSYYVAVSSGDAKYAEMFGATIGLNKNQIEHTIWSDLDYSKIDKADLISIGYNENEMLGFASNQMVAFISDYVSTDLRAYLTGYVSSVVESIALLNMFGFKKVATDMINSTIDQALATEMFAGKTMQELDWASIVGEEQLPYIELAREEIKKTVTENLGSEAFIIEFDIVDWLYENADSFGMNATVTKLLKNKDNLYSLLGENAVIKLELPVMDGVIFAMESYLYGYVKYTKDSIDLVTYISETNPDAKIVLMGSYNPMAKASLEFNGEKIAIGDGYSAITFAYNAKMLAQYATTNNSTFVFIHDATSVFDEAVINGSGDANFINFFINYLNDPSIINLSDAGNEYIVEQMKQYVKNVCENHKYSNDCDTECNRCGATREVEHFYTDCDDTICNYCDHERTPDTHVYSHCEDVECDKCGKPRAKVYHSLDGCEDTVCDICGTTVTVREHTYDVWKLTKAPTDKAEGEESSTCTVCGKVVTRVVPALTNDTKDGNGLVIGIIIGSVVLVCAIGFCIYWFVIRKKNAATDTEESEKDESNDNNGESENTDAE